MATWTATGLVLAGAVSTGGCATGGGVATPFVAAAPIRYVEPAEARELQLKQGALVVDIGDRSRFDRHRIEGATQQPLAALAERPPGGATSLVLYDSGFGAVYSDAAQAPLRQLGDRAVVIRGGLAAWERSGLPVRGSADDVAGAACDLVTVAELRRALDQLDDFTVVDLRSKQDYEAGHIQRAVSAMPHELDQLYKRLSKGKWAIFYDQGGSGAELMANEAAKKGVRHCGYLVGGYDAWAGKEPKPGRQP
jgi:rhodanese-related sulfurtransferase